MSVLITTMVNEVTDISFTDFERQVLKIWGTKVMQERVPATRPKISGLK